MKHTKYILFALMVLTSVTAGAKKKTKVFYDSKSNIVGITGSYDELSRGGINAKFFNNKIDFKYPDVTDPGVYSIRLRLNQMDIGKKVLDFLLQRNSGKLSYDLLRQRALQNAQLADEEIADASFLDTETLLSDDIMPILKNNYIYLTYEVHPRAGTTERTKWGMMTYSGRETFLLWFLYKVNITDNVIHQVESAWNDLAAYDRIPVSVSFVASGKRLVKATDNKNLNKVMRELSQEVPVLAVRGQALKGRRAAVGINQGLRKKDRLDVYRQIMANDSSVVSEKIGSVRAAGLKGNTTGYVPISGKTPSYKQGDMLVWSRDHRTALSVLGRVEDKSKGVGVHFDRMLTLNRVGISTHLLLDGSVSFYEKFGTRLYKVPGYSDYVCSPYYIDLGLGCGVGFNYNHFQLMGYGMCQLESIYMGGVNIRAEGKTAVTSGNDDAISTYLYRLPLGVKANININYPLQLTVGAEYHLLLKGAKQSETSDKAWSYDYFKKTVLKPMGYNREGLSFYAGLRFCF